MHLGEVQKDWTVESLMVENMVEWLNLLWPIMQVDGESSWRI